MFYGNGESEDQETDFNYYGDIFPREYTCPECGKVISTDREKAQKFLQTGKLDWINILFFFFKFYKNA